MARNNDSFDMDKWSNGKTKPEKEKKEKDSFSTDEKEFKIKESSSFDLKIKKEKAPKEPKVPKAIKEDKDAFFEIERKSIVKSSRKTKEDRFEAFEEPKEKKQFKFDLKDKKTRNIFIISLSAVVLIVVAVATATIITNIFNEPASIFISHIPNDTEYYIGDKADYTGLTIGIVKKNGQIDYIEYTKENSAEFIISGFDSSSVQQGQNIRVLYKGFSATFFVEIKDIPQATSVLKSITLEVVPKTEYKVGDRLDTTGGIILCEYKDGSILRINLTNSNVSGFSKIDGPGEYELTVKYKENGVIATTTYTITVTE